MESLFVYLTNLSSNAAYGIIFGILLACGIGFPLPEDVPLIASGYLVFDGTMLWIPAIFVALTGVLIGDSILFFLGRNMGLRLLEHPGLQAFFKPEKVRRTRAYFRKYGDKLIFFARFVAGFRAATFFMAGAMKMEYRRFIFLDGLAAAISVPLWIAVGYILGYYFEDEISLILKSMKEVKTAVTLVALLIVAIVAFRAFLRVRKTRREQEAAGRRIGNKKSDVSTPML
jgi:membrane protein DedA with SNARE-associated domain